MTDNPRYSAGHRVVPRRSTRAGGPSFEWRVVDLPRELARSEAAALLAEQAEHGSWELARSVIYIGGARRVWLKRRRMRVVRTDAA